MIEDETTEFKAEYSDGIVKSAVAFLNTRGGVIYVGIADDGTVCGVDDPDGLTRKIVQELTDNIRPDVMRFMRAGPEEIDGKAVVKIVVMEGTEKPFYLRKLGICSKGVYVRRGPASVQISDSALMKMIRDEAPLRYESAASIYQDLTFNQTASVFEEYNVAFGEPQKKTLGFFTDSGKYTNLAFVLSDQNDQGTKMAAYDSRFKEEIVLKDETYGSVLKQLNDILNYVRSLNRITTKITGLAHEDTRAYPETAVREAVVNALVHRDYSIDGPILVSFIGRNLTVTSLGGLPLRIGMDDLLMGISSPRNPKLAGVFQRLGFIEAHGTGIPRIMSCYKDQIFQPRIDCTDNTFRITLPPSDFRTSNPAMREVMAYLARNGPSARDEIENGIGASRSKTTNVLNLLISSGIVETVGEGRSTKYRLV